jgi:methylmalonyl-CoA/ethylmalonyl-CoA epimerase
MITGVDHIAIAVENLEDAVKLYEKVLGIKPEQITPFDPQKVKVAIFKVGETKIELISPLSPESAVTKFLQKRGEGLHHIAFKVDKIEEALNTLKREGIRLVDEQPRLGVEGAKVAFLHPKSLKNVLIELCQK